MSLYNKHDIPILVWKESANWFTILLRNYADDKAKASGIHSKSSIFHFTPGREYNKIIMIYPCSLREILLTSLRDTRIIRQYADTNARPKRSAQKAAYWYSTLAPVEYITNCSLPFLMGTTSEITLMVQVTQAS